MFIHLGGGNFSSILENTQLGQEGGRDFELLSMVLYKPSVFILSVSMGQRPSCIRFPTEHIYKTTISFS